MAFIQQVFTLPSMVTGNSVTTLLYIPGSWLYMYLEVPPNNNCYSTGVTPLWIQASVDSGTTSRRFSNPETNTNTVGTNDFQIVSACTNRMVIIPQFAMKYISIEMSGTVTGAVSQPPFKLICVSNQ